MSCWVVPMIAAEYLKVPLAEIHERIRAGAIPVRVENGFTFVDVLPEAENLPLPLPRPAPAPTPPTYQVVTREEYDALTAPLEIEADDEERFPWRIARAAAASRRVAPQRIAA